MAYKPTPKKATPFDPYLLKPLEFQEFIRKFPDVLLEKAEIKRGVFVSVSMMLSRHGQFKTGTEIRPSVGTLADEAGVSKPTVRRVLAYLQEIKVLALTGTYSNPGGGTPVNVYRLVKVPLVGRILHENDRDWGKVKQRTTEVVSGGSPEPLRVNQGTAEGKTENHNKDHKKIKESSVDKSPSPAQTRSGLTASASAVSQEEEQEQTSSGSEVWWDDEVLAEFKAEMADDEP